MKEKAIEWDKELKKLHREQYSDCMRKIYDYKEAMKTKDDGDMYGKVFYVNSNKTERPIEKDVNKCRTISIDYWREVLAFKKEYPDYVTKHKLDKVWSPSHQRFVNLVSHLKLPEHNEEENEVFDLKSFDSKQTA
ncbi:MAG: hypothetical protein ACYC56_08465 [Candidatus Aquicultor sp.]